MICGIVLGLLLLLSAGKAVTVQPILMRDIPVLSFYKDGYTGTMRGQPIPQMTLHTSGVPKSAVPEEIVCTNMGWDGLNVHWDCKAEVPESWKLARPVISCEGWSGPGDEYVVPGSCAIDYEMDYKPVKHESQTPKTSTWRGNSNSDNGNDSDSKFFRANTWERPTKKSSKTYREHLESMRDELNWAILIDDIFNAGLSAILGFSLVSIIGIVLVIFLCVKCHSCCCKSNGNTAQSNTRSKSWSNVNNDDSDRCHCNQKEDEDVVESHAHAISYSR